jgi:hypothetical protein
MKIQVVLPGIVNIIADEMEAAIMLRSYQIGLFDHTKSQENTPEADRWISMYLDLDAELKRNGMVLETVASRIKKGDN